MGDSNLQQGLRNTKLQDVYNARAVLGAWAPALALAVAVWEGPGASPLPGQAQGYLMGQLPGHIWEAYDHQAKLSEDSLK